MFSEYLGKGRKGWKEYKEKMKKMVKVLLRNKNYDIASKLGQIN